MKKMFLVSTILLSLCVGFSGCASISRTDPSSPEYVQTLESEVVTLTTIATGVYILSIDNPTERKETAKLANQVSNDIQQALNNRELTLDQLKVYATELVIKAVNDDDQATVGLLFNALTTYIESKIEILNVNLDKYDAGRRFILAATEVVITLTNPYVIEDQSEPIAIPMPRDTE